MPSLNVIYFHIFRRPPGAPVPSVEDNDVIDDEGDGMKGNRGMFMVASASSKSPRIRSAVVSDPSTKFRRSIVQLKVNTSPSIGAQYCCPPSIHPRSVVQVPQRIHMVFFAPSERLKLNATRWSGSPVVKALCSYLKGPGVDFVVTQCGKLSHMRK